MPQIKLRQDTVRTLAFIGRHTKQQCIYWDTTLPTFGGAGLPRDDESTLKPASHCSRPLSAAAIHRLQAIPRIEGNPHVFCGRKLGGHLTTLTDPVTLTEPQSMVAEALLPALDSEPTCTPISAPTRPRHYFKREALYELVWTARV